MATSSFVKKFLALNYLKVFDTQIVKLKSYFYYYKINYVILIAKKFIILKF